MAAFMFYISTHGDRSIPVGLLIFSIISTLLYPYSRFVYESIVGFIVGNHVFFVNTIPLVITKFFTMALCWGAAIFIAPVGLAYLYFHHSKSVSDMDREQA
jgi:hypothetical protein